jgi:hypothetical protein
VGSGATKPSPHDNTQTFSALEYTTRASSFGGR